MIRIQRKIFQLQSEFNRLSEIAFQKRQEVANQMKVIDGLNQSRSYLEGYCGFQVMCFLLTASRNHQN